MTESEAILAADANRRAAMISANRNQLESIFSERLVWTHSSGAVEHREAFIANIESGSVRYLELGMLERALQLTIDYVRERKAFGQPLLDFQNTSFSLAEVKTEATIARVFIDHCTELLLKGELDAATASMAKLWVTEREVEGIHRCLQFFGGYGYMNEYPIAQLYRDARIDTIHGGTSEIMKLLIARTL